MHEKQLQSTKPIKKKLNIMLEFEYLSEYMSSPYGELISTSKHFSGETFIITNFHRKKR